MDHKEQFIRNPEVDEGLNRISHQRVLVRRCRR